MSDTAPVHPSIAYQQAYMRKLVETGSQRSASIAGGIAYRKAEDTWAAHYTEQLGQQK